MNLKRTYNWIFHRARCFLCDKRFKKGDGVVEFFGAWGHWQCIDKQLKENAKND